MIDLSGFKLTYDDEFNSFKSSPDGSSGYQTTFYFGGRELYSNNDLQYYSDSTVGVNPFSLANGALQITASPGTNPDHQLYNSGLITTEGMFSQLYGYFEARVEVAPGAGMWSSFWMLPADKGWPPEIDIMEAFGAPNSVPEGGGQQVWHNQITVGHTADSGLFATATGGDIHTTYHTYGVDWEPDFTTWYIDGQQVGRLATPSTTNNPMYMLLDLEVGGWAGQPAGETGVMGVDYIRAYSKAPTAQAVALQTISSPDGVDTTPYGATDARGVIGGAPTPPAPPAGTNLSVRVSEDAWTGNAQFTVKVDGVQVGGTQTATAIHSAGQWQDIALAGTFATGPHTIDVTFINDGWGGTTTTDRNLYVQSVTLNGDTLDWHSAQNGAAVPGQTATDGALLAVNGTIHFTDPGSGGTTTPPPPTPPPPTSPPPPAGTGLSVRVSEDAWTGDAQFIVKVDGVQVGGTQTATALHSAGQWQDIALAGTFATGPHTVDVTFINDTWGGTTTTDRNLYVQSVTLNGDTLSWTSAQNGGAVPGQTAPDGALLAINGTIHFNDPGSGGTTTPPPSPPPPTGTFGPSTIVLHVAEDAWTGDAQFNVLVDGVQIGGAQTATASHAAHAVQDITLTGNFGTQGPGTVDVVFFNDAWGGTPTTDRNLYVYSIDVNGHSFAGTAAFDNASNGATAPDAAVMQTNGTVEFNINHSAPPAIIG